MKGYKLLTIVFCIIITIVIVIFCNDENIDTTKKVNDQKLANLFAIIFSSVGTFAAILFSQKQIDFAAASTVLTSLPYVLVDELQYECL